MQNERDSILLLVTDTFQGWGSRASVPEFFYPAT